MLNRLNTWFRRKSVTRKLSTTVLTTSGVTLMAACAVYATCDYVNSRSRLVRDVTMLADIIGTNSTAAALREDTPVFLEDLPGRLAEIRDAVTARNAAEAAWRQLSVEASNVSDVLSRHSAPAKEPYSCVS